MLKNIYDNLVNKLNFEKREEQLKMSSIIEKGLNEEIPVLIEAETGSGKTLAYLIPTILNSIEKGEKLVISTNTINLQDQIIKKELPLIEKILDRKLNYTLIKGRNNYVCKRKLEEYYSKNKDIDYLIDAINSTKNGDIGEIKAKISPEIWKEIRSEKETTLSKRCPYFKSCYYYKSKQENENADIFIVNHHILLLDLILREKNETSIIPNYNTVVIDEAHNLEDILRKYFSKTFSFLEAFKNIGLLHNRNAKSKEVSGYLYKLFIEMSKFDKNLNIDDLYNEYILKIDNIYDNLLELMKIINKKYSNIKSIGVAIENLYNNEIKNILNNVFFDIEELNNNFKIINSYLEYNDNELDTLVTLVNNYYNNIKSFIEDLIDIFKFDYDKNIYWLKYEDSSNIYPLLNSTPYDVSSRFYNDFIEKKKKIIFISATLTVDNDFKYIKNNLGLKECIEANIESSFDYKKQMNMYFIDDLPLPNEENFIKEASDFLFEYIKKVDGKTFILFTSYYDLNLMYKYFLDKNTEFNLLKQGDFSRNELIDRFKNTEKSVLFGTDSFWEGVDVQGEALSNVVIVKLPFQVPDDPIVKNISKRMKSPFMDYQLPIATIKLKQGVGRLIRSKNDKGNVIILDKRIFTKSYGKIMLRSLPKSNRKILKSKELLE